MEQAIAVAHDDRRCEARPRGRDRPRRSVRSRLGSEGGVDPQAQGGGPARDGEGRDRGTLRGKRAQGFGELLPGAAVTRRSHRRCGLGRGPDEDAMRNRGAHRERPADDRRGLAHARGRLECIAQRPGDRAARARGRVADEIRRQGRRDLVALRPLPRQGVGPREHEEPGRDDEEQRRTPGLEGASGHAACRERGDGPRGGAGRSFQPRPDQGSHAERQHPAGEEPDRGSGDQQRIHAGPAARRAGQRGAVLAQLP